MIDKPGGAPGSGIPEYIYPGLTKREYFAGLAMQGLLAAVYSNKEMLDEFLQAKYTSGDEHFARQYLSGCEAISKNAVNYADALIAELQKKGE